jgi:hypothetical protein
MMPGNAGPGATATIPADIDAETPRGTAKEASLQRKATCRMETSNELIRAPLPRKAGKARNRSGKPAATR